VLGVGNQKERVESGEKENVLGVGDQKEREESGENETFFSFFLISNT
jgi:hypothetical protein